MKTPICPTNIYRPVLIAAAVLAVVSLVAGTHSIREPLRIASAMAFVSALLLHKDVGNRIFGIVIMLLYLAQISWGLI